MIEKGSPFISVIIPTFNEESNPYYLKSLKSLSEISDLELIIVDRSSQDKTQAWAREFSALVLMSTQNSRAGRLNEGISAAKGKVILLHHPRSIIEINFVDLIKKNYKNLSWGGLTHVFDHSHYFYKFTSWYSNTIRGKFNQILYLDHCIFFRADIFTKEELDQGLVPVVDIFEDTLLSYRLQNKGDITILPSRSWTSPIRFQNNGILRQALLNQSLKLAFYVNVSPCVINRIYEKNLSLNSHYSIKNTDSVS